ncbi:MAG: hypothetical protein OEW35_07620 [Gammaproteobacteria bacterium]|nr:hypothetical protein [Gammaproteobacteria bacterium]MDH4254117.1 hypothetical protein [Gammaproteobacteria bacterium]MDH5309065.1 hypothetical protein [Gammaproteobacteria bacterium]
MTDRIELEVIEPGIDQVAVGDIAARLAPGSDASVQRGLWYPYFRFDADCSARALFGRRGMQLNCLVDGLTGLAATAPSFCSTRDAVPRADVLPASLMPDAALLAARRYLATSLGRGFRTIADFDIRLADRGTIHKLYWLVAIDDGQVLVDSLTGGWIPMTARAA